MGGADDTDNNSRADPPEDDALAAMCRVFVDSTSDIFTHIGLDGEMTYVTSTERMLGRSREEFLQTPLDEYLHPDDKERGVARFESALAGEETTPIELRFRHGDGHWVWIEASTSTVPAEYDLDGVVTVTREVTERKRREEELEETRAELEASNRTLKRQNRRLDRFAAVVSHDLRNPLSVASGRLELAREECESEHFDAIENSLDRMSRMIDELYTLTASESRAETTTSVSIASRAKTAWETTETSDSVLDVRIDREVQYEADPGLLDHVFENLFRNAVVHNRGPVTVSVGALDDRRGFYVADDGVGVPSTHADDVFEHGYSAHEGGTGFGLGIVREFVEAHGWAISLAESEGGGARFEITLE